MHKREILTVLAITLIVILLYVITFYSTNVAFSPTEKLSHKGFFAFYANIVSEVNKQAGIQLAPPSDSEDPRRQSGMWG